MSKQQGTTDPGQIVRTVKCPTLGGKPDSSKKSTPAGPTSSGKKNRSGKKKALKAPFIHEWPPVSDAACAHIVSLLKETFESEGLRRDLCMRAGKKVQQKSKAKPSTADVDNCLKWNSLIFGINAVTRSLEKATTSLMLCDRNTYPNQLTSHLIELCAYNRIPAASITGLSSLAGTVGLRSLTTVAFKPLNEIENERLKSTITSIVTKLPAIKSPIQSQNVHKLDLTQGTETEATATIKSSIQSQNVHKLDLTQGTETEATATELPGVNTSNPVPALPPDDVDFSSLYVFKDSLNFTKQEDFISLGAVLKRQSDAQPDKGPVNKLRYMSTQVGLVKYNPNRPKVDRTKKGS